MYSDVFFGFGDHDPAGIAEKCLSTVPAGFKKGKGILVVVETVNQKTKEKEYVWQRVIPNRSHSESTYKKALNYCKKYSK